MHYTIILLLHVLFLILLLLSISAEVDEDDVIDVKSLGGTVLVKSHEGELMTDGQGNLKFYWNPQHSREEDSSDLLKGVDGSVTNESETKVTEEQAIYAARAVLEHLQMKLFSSSSAVSSVGSGTTMKNSNSGNANTGTLLSGFKTLFLDKPVKYPPSYKNYTDGLNIVRNLTAVERLQDDELARERREHIREAMRHAWNGYKKYAWGKDELRPVMKTGRDTYGGMGVTLVDSLDTLWLMDMKKEFYEARDWVRDHLSHDIDSDISVFETTIRSLGGLLAAYDLSGDEVFLERADDLGSRLLNAFDSPSGIPYGVTNMNRNISFNVDWTGGNSILSELGTLQVEFRYLAKATGKDHYASKADKVFELMKSIAPHHGLYPIFVNNEGAPAFRTGSNKITFGAMGDSFYEYMLKIWLQGGKSEALYRDMWDQAMDGLHDFLLHKSSPSGLFYLTDINDNDSESSYEHKMEHLACFMGGALALGAYTDPLGLDSTRAQRDLQTGKALAYTCYQMYTRMMTGIAPEFVKFQEGKDFVAVQTSKHYLLRPETIETFYILYQLTGDKTYREWGWDIFQSIQKNCRTNAGYGGLWDVTSFFQEPMDRMESFFLAETLKYLYLLFDPDTELDILGMYVFNTEAHPLRIFPELDRISKGISEETCR